MTLVIRIVTLRDGGQEGLQQTQRIIHPLSCDRLEKKGYRGKPIRGILMQKTGKQALQQSHTYLLVGDIERVQIRERGIALYRDVTTLIEQGRNIEHPFRGGVKRLRQHFACAYLLGFHVILIQHLDQIGRCTTIKPIGTDFPLLKAVSKLNGL